MNENQNNIVVGVSGQRVFVKVHGKANFQNSQPFCQFSAEIIKRGFREFVVDLAECSYMDSTFLGVLAGISLRLMPLNGCVHLANLNPRCSETVASLGIDRLSTVDTCDLQMPAPANGDQSPPPDTLQPLAAPQTGPADAESKARHAEMMLEAHRTLMQIDPRNIPKFKDCAHFLAEDLDKLRAAQRNSNS
ncbi:MAG: STAS domain-containing protein [Verrucomicrobia bacterium]|nr:STAS domain-containing protein [Verrucomicrobiota bacterium]